MIASVTSRRSPPRPGHRVSLANGMVSAVLTSAMRIMAVKILGELTCASRRMVRTINGIPLRSKAGALGRQNNAKFRIVHRFQPCWDDWPRRSRSRVEPGRPIAEYLYAKRG
jgi:hypothetical protein